jgi:hypothetical protein
VPVAPEGLLLRLAPDRAARRLDAERARLERSTPRAVAVDAWGESFLDAAARAWRALAREAAAGGEPATAAACEQRARALDAP